MKIDKFNQRDFNRIVNKILYENEVKEDFFGDLRDKYRGLKGIKRGYGMDYFENMSKLERLVSKLQKLDEPNRDVIKELSDLLVKVQSLNMPKDRKDALLTLIDRSVKYFNYYDNVNKRIIDNIKNLKLDDWS